MVRRNLLEEWPQDDIGIGQENVGEYFKRALFGPRLAG
jgi:hypothetical protein